MYLVVSLTLHTSLSSRLLRVLRPRSLTLSAQRRKDIGHPLVEDGSRSNSTSKVTIANTDLGIQQGREGIAVDKQVLILQVFFAQISILRHGQVVGRRRHARQLRARGGLIEVHVSQVQMSQSQINGSRRSRSLSRSIIKVTKTLNGQISEHVADLLAGSIDDGGINVQHSRFFARTATAHRAGHVVTQRPMALHVAVKKAVVLQTHCGS
ncbi:hypothetical protein QBC47DRAFT_431759 [Echria macrotheca]|uniref:Uncharacterized protein n=1 Tax=Echria macrotheca TaxID=438768 RepID=A0AAJ0F3C5_9PEZI|nr:hypothetical protein QBC47DRAFT_431759 [Echria macrotheca]